MARLLGLEGLGGYGFKGACTYCSIRANLREKPPDLDTLLLESLAGFLLRRTRN